MEKKKISLPLFEENEQVKRQIEQALKKIRERPAIALVRVETSCERGGYGIYLLSQDKEGSELVRGVRIDDPDSVEICELAREQMFVLSVVEDLKALAVKAGLRKPRVFKFELQAKAS